MEKNLNTGLFNKELESTAESKAILSPAKVNLRLKIGGLRQDDYHILNMINAKVKIYDQIFITLKKEKSFEMSVSENDMPAYMLAAYNETEKQTILRDLNDVKKNLAAKAAQLFFELFDLKYGVGIKISKAIPLGAGLGGGSSNAAAVLGFLEQSFKEEILILKNISEYEYKNRIDKLAIALGSDIPFILRSNFAQVSGIGEVIAPLDASILEGRQIVVILPRLHIASKDVFALSRLDWADKTSLQTLGARLENPQDLSLLLENDLQSYACQLKPELREIFKALQTLSGLKFALSGSGSSIIGLPQNALKFTQNQVQGVREKLSGFKAEVILSQFI